MKFNKTHCFVDTVAKYGQYEKENLLQHILNSKTSVIGKKLDNELKLPIYCCH